MKPLEGIKVLELTNNLAAPTVGRNLADWGADVIKVETLKGDVWRKNGPAQGCPLTESVNPVFDNENLNKRWLALDPKREEGRAVIHRLLADSVIFVTNYRTEALRGMGLDYEALRDLYPGLIYAQVLGYGAKGPDCGRPGYDYTAFFARSGILADMSPAGGPPSNPFTGMGDHITAACLTAGILAALYRRAVTGEGDYVSAALLQAACFVLGTPLMTGFYGTSLYKRREQAKQPFSNTFQGSDGEWLYVAATNFYGGDFRRSCALIGLPELADDPRCATIADCRTHMAEIVPLLDEAFRKRTRDEWMEIFQTADLPCERVQHVDQLPEDPQIQANGFARRYTYPDGTPSIASGSPVTFGSFDVAAQPVAVSGPIGRDSDEILREHGYGAGDIAALRDSGVIR